MATDTKALALPGATQGPRGDATRAKAIVASGESNGWTGEQIALLKRTYCLGSTDDEFALFLGVCNRTRLDPFKKEIHAVRRKVKIDDRWVEVMSFQVGIDGFRKMSEETGLYEGPTSTMWCGKDGVWKDVWTADDIPFAARVGVYRKGVRDPIYGVAHYREYVQTKVDGTPNKMWATMPANQLAKCAEALAHRKAFPQSHAGLYTDDEMGQADNPRVEHPPQPVSAPAGQPAAVETAFAGTPSPSGAKRLTKADLAPVGGALNALVDVVQTAGIVLGQATPELAAKAYAKQEGLDLDALRAAVKAGTATQTAVADAVEKLKAIAAKAGPAPTARGTGANPPVGADFPTDEIPF